MPKGYLNADRLAVFIDLIGGLPAILECLGLGRGRIRHEQQFVRVFLIGQVLELLHAQRGIDEVVEL